MRKISLLFFACFFISTSFSQKQFSKWFASFNTIGVTKNFSLHIDAQFRTAERTGWQQHYFLFRPGINFKASQSLSLSAGYAYIFNQTRMVNNYGHQKEHRSWQQILFSHKLARMSLAHRLRLEQRFFKMHTRTPDPLHDPSAAHRLRYFFRDLIPFNRQEVFSKGVFAAIQNEVFVNLVKHSYNNGKFFDQNRLYGALGYRLYEVDFELGYMYQYVKNPVSSLKNHILQIALYTRL